MRARREEKQRGAKHLVGQGRSTHDLRQIADRMCSTSLPCLCVHYVNMVRISNKRGQAAGVTVILFEGSQMMSPRLL